MVIVNETGEYNIHLKDVKALWAQTKNGRNYLTVGELDILLPTFTSIKIDNSHLMLTGRGEMNPPVFLFKTTVRFYIPE